MLGFLRKRGSANSCEPGNHSTTVTYTRNKATLTVNFTGPNDGTFVAPSTITQQITIGESYSVSVPIVQNYSASQNTVSGTMVDEGVTVNISYTRITATLTITYVGPNDGNFVTPSVYSTTVNAGDSYSVNSPAVSTYTPDIATVSGTMPTTDVSVTVTYTRDAAILNITYTGPDDGVFVAPESYSTSVYVGDAYSVSSPTVTGYVPSTATVSGTMTSAGYSTTVTYSKVVTIQITYAGPINTFFDTPSQYTSTIAAGAAYSVTSPSRTGFTPDQAIVEGIAGTEDVSVEVTYSRQSDLEIYAFSYIGSTESNPDSKIVYPSNCDNANWSPVRSENITNTTEDNEKVSSLGCEWDNAFFIKDIKMFVVNKNGTIVCETKRDDCLIEVNTNTQHTFASGEILCTRIPRVYVYYDSTSHTYYFSNYKLNSNFISIGHLNQSGTSYKYLYISRNVMKQTSTSTVPVVYSYEPLNDTGLDWNIPYSGIQYVNNDDGSDTSSSTMIAKIADMFARGDYNGNYWKIFNFSTWRFINLLIYLIGKTTDVWSIFGDPNSTIDRYTTNAICDPGSTYLFNGNGKNQFGMYKYTGIGGMYSTVNGSTTRHGNIYQLVYGVYVKGVIGYKSVSEERDRQGNITGYTYWTRRDYKILLSPNHRNNPTTSNGYKHYSGAVELTSLAMSALGSDSSGYYVNDTQIPDYNTTEFADEYGIIPWPSKTIGEGSSTTYWCTQTGFPGSSTTRAMIMAIRHIGLVSNFNSTSAGVSFRMISTSNT